MDTAGILQRNGILSAEQPVTEELPAEDKDTRDETPPPAGSGSINHAATGHLSVNLPSGLIVSYPQSLAPAFAFGEFGATLRALDKAVSDYVATNTVVEADKETDNG